MRFETVKKLGATMLAMFLVFSFWRNPSASADSFGNFVGDVGGLFSNVIDKGAQFIKGLAS